MRNAVLLVLCSFLLLGAASAKDKKLKNASKSSQIIDSGTFGIYVSGRRVATEKFSIEQRPDSSIATSELQTGESGAKPAQRSEMQMAPNGDLMRYTWRELMGNKAQTVVEPSNEFLIEHITPTPESKPEDTPFLMPHSTAILDDYFFSQRQLLAWRYLAQACGPNAAGKTECNLTRTQFGVVIPQQRLSTTVTLEFAGKEKVLIHGAQRELNRINLAGEGYEWSMWFDDANKMVRVLLKGENTEVVRD